MATIEQFMELEMRVGLVIAAHPFPEARKPAYKLEIDFGPMGTRRSSAQLTALYQADELLGRRVIAVLNLPPRRVAGFVSEVLVLGVPDSQGQVALLQPDRDVPLGGRVY